MTYDPAADPGSHVTQITIDGAPINLDATYTVAANAFLAGGGDQFNTMGMGANRADTGKTDLHSMVDWFAQFAVASPDLAQRSVGVTVSEPAGAGFVAGEDITVELSSLAFSAGEPAPVTASISLAGSTLATARIDPAIVDTTDEAGRATLTFAAPAGVTGMQDLSVTVDGNDTRAIVPVGFAAAATGQLALDRATAEAGSAVVISGNAFAAGTTLELELRSQPVSLGAVTADEAGAFAQVVTIPATTPAGAHEIVAIQPDGTEAIAALTVTSEGSSRGADGGDTNARGTADGNEAADGNEGASDGREGDNDGRKDGTDDRLANTGMTTGQTGTAFVGTSGALMAVGLLALMLAQARRGRARD